MKIRFAVAVLASCAVMGACNGWPESAPFEEAENRPEKYPTYAAAEQDASVEFTFEDRRWVINGTADGLRAAWLKPVGSSAGASLYAPAGDQPPYPVLYIPATGNRWLRVLPVD